MSIQLSGPSYTSSAPMQGIVQARKDHTIRAKTKKSSASWLMQLTPYTDRRTEKQNAFGENRDR